MFFEISNKWILDSRANQHTTGNFSLLCNYHPSSVLHVHIINGKIVTIIGQGTTYISDHIKLHNVLYVSNLISLSCSSDDYSYYIQFQKGGAGGHMSSDDDW